MPLQGFRNGLHGRDKQHGELKISLLDRNGAVRGHREFREGLCGHNSRGAVADATASGGAVAVAGTSEGAVAVATTSGGTVADAATSGGPVAVTASGGAVAPRLQWAGWYWPMLYVTGKAPWPPELEEPPKNCVFSGSLSPEQKKKKKRKSNYGLGSVFGKQGPQIHRYGPRGNAGPGGGE